MVNGAVASGNKATIESLKDTLEGFNNSAHQDSADTEARGAAFC